MRKTELAPAERATPEEVQAEARLFAGGDRLQHLVAETSPLIVVVLNPQRQIVHGNRRLVELTGRTLPELIGLRPGQALGCEHSEQAPAGCGTTVFCGTCGAVRAILSSLGGAEDIQECRLTRHDGTALDLRVWTSPLEIDGVRFGLFMAQDISDEKRRQALEHAFFHDVLNTAGAALGWAILDDSLPGGTEEARARLPGIIRRLIDEIHSHRDLAEMEQGRYEVNLATVDGARLLRNLVDDWQEHPCARGKQLKLAPMGEVDLVTDATLLRRVLSNMIKNALEASAEGERVLVRGEVADGRARFSVTNPAEMPRQVQLQLFQRSFSTRGPGRGIGTYSMRLLSERFLGGTVTFSSTADAGTTFVASYPVRLRP